MGGDRAGDLLALILAVSFGLELWTDALWFQSVQFDSVFWTRLTAQLGLFLVAAIGALVIVLLNVAIATRQTRGMGTGRSPFRDWFERLNDAARPAADRRPRGTAAARRTVTFGPDDIPDLTPSPGWSSPGWRSSSR